MKQNPITISREQWIEGGRNAVLDALDQFTRVSVGHVEARGWTDPELPNLFRAVDRQLGLIADRINSGEEPGSAFFQVEEEQL